jgi:four helix bundle protein
MMSDIETFEDLDVWKRGCQLAVDVHVAFHGSKAFAMKSQKERSSMSIPPNIAEGCERDSTADFIKFLRYSKGSCGELRTQLYVADKVRQRLDLPSLENSRSMIHETRELSRMLQGLINALKPRLNKSTDH